MGFINQLTSLGGPTLYDWLMAIRPRARAPLNRAAQVINPLEDLVRQAKAEFPQIQGRNSPWKRWKS